MKVNLDLPDPLAAELRALIPSYGADLPEVLTFLARAWLHEHGEAVERRAARRWPPAPPLGDVLWRCLACGATYEDRPDGTEPCPSCKQVASRAAIA